MTEEASAVERCVPVMPSKEHTIVRRRSMALDRVERAREQRLHPKRGRDVYLM